MMNIDSGLLEGVRVEDMSNAELYQYLFKADLDDDLLPLDDLDIPTLPSTEALDAAAAAETLSPSSSLDSSASSPLVVPCPPYSPPTSDMSMGSSSPQELPFQLAVVSSGSPTLLSSASFSYRQLTPDMPPSKPTMSPDAPESSDSSHPQEAAALAKLPAYSPSSETPATLAFSSVNTSHTPSEQTNLWMQRFQQLQQLQQLHHKQQQQLLATRLLGAVEETSSASSSSLSFQKQRSASPTGSSSSSSTFTSPAMQTGAPEKDKEVIYPSPPMRDDMALDSDSDSHTGHHGHQQEEEDRDPLKPSPSELKKMTSKERRQLRNKLSARNFRVRRKEYIGSLENQVKDAKKENAELQRKLVQAELNIQFLRQELETVRLQQSLFTDSTMTRDHANLLASLLNPSTETFPSSTSASLPMASPSSTAELNTLSASSLLSQASTSTAATSQQSTWQQQQELMNSIHFNNMTILNNNISSLPFTPQSQQQQQASNLFTSSTTEASTNTFSAEPTTASIRPFIPFENDWELSVNRAVLPDANVDPKEGLVHSDEDIHQLLIRYEEVKREYERDEQMRMELKAYSEERLAKSFVVMPPLATKSGMPSWSPIDKSSVDNSSMILQAIVYIMMLQLTKALFEAATLSKSQIVDMFQKMDGPLRSRMLLTQSQDEEETRAGRGRSHCKFSQWREAWIKKCWPSFYNNRQRLCTLIKNHICAPQEEHDAVQMARLMEEGAAADLALATPSFAERARYYLPDWLKCPEVVEMDRMAQKRREERNALIEAARARQQQQQQQQEATVSA